MKHLKTFESFDGEKILEKKKAKGLPPWLKKGKKKSAKEDSKEEKVDKKETKGLTTAQKRLPEGLKKAILARKK